MRRRHRAWTPCADGSRRAVRCRRLPSGGEEQGHQADHRRGTYVAPRSMTSRRARPTAALPPHPAGPGLRRLPEPRRLVTDAHVDGYYYKPRIDREHLARHRAWLIGLSACLGEGGEGARGRRLGTRSKRPASTARSSARIGSSSSCRITGCRSGRASTNARAPRRGYRGAARRHQRPALRPCRPVRGARRPVCRDR